VKASENEARAKAETAKVEAAQYTLKALLTDYCDHLEALGRVSHREARSILTLHVTKAWSMVEDRRAIRVGERSTAPH